MIKQDVVSNNTIKSKRTVMYLGSGLEFVITLVVTTILLVFFIYTDEPLGIICSFILGLICAIGAYIAPITMPKDIVCIEAMNDRELFFVYKHRKHALRYIRSDKDNVDPTAEIYIYELRNGRRLNYLQSARLYNALYIEIKNNGGLKRCRGIFDIYHPESKE